MRSLSLHEILIRNFRSFKVDWIQFPQTAGLKLLTGDNKLEPKLGANGAGKSSLWDAFVWCLTGNSIKGAKISDILAWGEIGAQVICRIDVGSDIHIIERTGPPNKIIIDDKPSTQEQLDQLLGLSRMRLLHSVVFGQGIALFPDLPTPKRGELFDEVLDLEVWSKCSEVATQKYKLLSDKHSNKKLILSNLQGKLSGISTDESIIAQQTEWQEEWEKELKFLEGKIQSWEEEKDKHLQEIDGFSNTWIQQQQVIISDLQQQEEQWKEEALQRLEEKANKIEELETEGAALDAKLQLSVDNPFSAQLLMLDNNFVNAEIQAAMHGRHLYQASDDLKRLLREAPLWEEALCPSCRQPITEEKRKFEIRAAEQQRKVLLEMKQKAEEGLKAARTLMETTKLEIQKLRDISSREHEIKKATAEALSKITKQIEELVGEATQLVNARDTKNPFTKSIVDHKKKDNPYIAQRETIQNKLNPFINSVATHKEKLNPFISLLASNKKQREELQSKVDIEIGEIKQVEASLVAIEYWKHGFKRIRLFFIEQILLALQIEIGSALSALGLEGWKVTLATESETKSGSVKLGISIHIKSPKSEGSWDVWSGGETQRLRLAIAMGLSSLIQRAAGVWYNLEVWDEPTNWLGAEGIEDLLEALRYRAESQNKQIWIVDHRALTYSGFKEIYGAVKDEEGTKIIKVTESED